MKCPNCGCEMHEDEMFLGYWFCSECEYEESRRC